MTMHAEITYLRKGRKVRASGSVVSSYDNGAVKVDPRRPGWKHIIVTRQEIDAGSEKPPIIPRIPKPPEEPKPKRPPKPKDSVINPDELALPLCLGDSPEMIHNPDMPSPGERLLLMFGQLLAIDLPPPIPNAPRKSKRQVDHL